MKLFHNFRFWTRNRCLPAAVVIIALFIVSSPRWAEAQEFRSDGTGDRPNRRGAQGSYRNRREQGYRHPL